MDFPLNWPRYAGASILLARKNFGCGSSREHAPWALGDYGFRAIIAPGYADIFFNNCFKNGLLPIVLNEQDVDKLFIDLEEQEGFSLAIDLMDQTITRPDGNVIHFEVEAFRKQRLLEGLDEIGLTLRQADSIKDFEKNWEKTCPWLFGAIS